jgi:hypothetical protein
MKNYSINLCIFSVILFSSCNKNIVDSNFTGKNNYKTGYIVDSINIDDPVRIESLKYGGMYIISKSTLSSFRNNRSFFLRPDVFIFGGDFYWDLPLNDYPKYKYPDYGNCIFVKSDIKIEGLAIYEFQKEPCFFILGLINVKYYNQKHNSFDVKNNIIREKNEALIYYKVVYPLCK